MSFVGRVLHGDAVRAGEHGFEAGVQFLPARILGFAAGQRVEAALLDAVHQLARLARGGNEVVPAARDVGLRVEAKNARGDGIAMVVVVEEPAVEGGVAESGLDCVEIHTGIGYAGRRSGVSGVSGLAAVSGVRPWRGGVLPRLLLALNRSNVDQRERRRRDAGNAAGLADGDGADALQRFAHLAREAADDAVLDPLGDGDGLGGLELSMDFFCCSR
jgi:hypothetical protein